MYFQWGNIKIIGLWKGKRNTQNYHLLNDVIELANYIHQHYK